MIKDTGCDFYDVNDVKIPDPASVNKTTDVDAWGCRWNFALAGKAGVVSYSPLGGMGQFQNVQDARGTQSFRQRHRNRRKNARTVSGWGSVEGFFQIMQNLRGTENIMTDFYTQPEEVQKLIDRMMTEYHLPAIEEQLKLKPDILGLGDDWGTQTALLISPALWRQFMKPVYKKMIDLCHQGEPKRGSIPAVTPGPFCRSLSIWGWM